VMEGDGDGDRDEDVEVQRLVIPVVCNMGSLYFDLHFGVWGESIGIDGWFVRVCLGVVVQPCDNCSGAFYACCRYSTLSSSGRRVASNPAQYQ
jgi:hypothetical protein